MILRAVNEPGAPGMKNARRRALNPLVDCGRNLQTLVSSLRPGRREGGVRLSVAHTGWKDREDCALGSEATVRLGVYPLEFDRKLRPFFAVGQIQKRAIALREFAGDR